MAASEGRGKAWGEGGYSPGRVAAGGGEKRGRGEKKEREERWG
jgi:hypothetical protein